MQWILVVGIAVFLLWLLWDWVVGFFLFGLFLLLAEMSMMLAFVAVAGIGYGLWFIGNRVFTKSD